MTQATKKVKYDSSAAATANYYNTTGTVLTAVQLPVDVSYLTTNHPTTTICVADTPVECTEAELVGLFSRYGSAIKAQKILNGRAALVEFSEISSPTRLVHMAKINPFYVGPCRVILDFSKESVAGGSTKTSAEASNDLNSTSDKLSKILNLKVTNAEYPITVDVIKAICEVHGKLAKIYIGKKDEEKMVKALVEYEKEDEAGRAKEQLDGADIYSGCCSLTVLFSKATKVFVEQNTSDQWDYTLFPKTLLNPLQPPEPPQQQTPQSQYTAPPVTYPPGYNYQNLPQNPYYAQYPGPHNQYWNGSYFNGPPGQMPSQGTAAQMHMMHPPAPHSYILLPTPAPVHHVTPEGIGIGHATSNLGSETAQRHSDMSIFSMEEGSILLACNLPPSLNCDHLFNILCVYGNIAKIKFLKSSKGFALIQFGTKEAADLVFKHYNNLDISGYCIKFYYSHNKELPEQAHLGTLEDGSPVMKNYMMDPNNRFRNTLVAAKSRILEPTRTLHFFNAPLQFTPPDMMHVFAEAGARPPPRVLVFTSKPGQKTALGLVEWDTTCEALTALCLCNHRPLHLSGYSHPFHMKLAFSPKPICEDRAGMTLIQYPAPHSSSPVRYYRQNEENLNFNVEEIQRNEEEYLRNMPPGGYPDPEPETIQPPLPSESYPREEVDSKNGDFRSDGPKVKSESGDISLMKSVGNGKSVSKEDCIGGKRKLSKELSDFDLPETPPDSAKPNGDGV